MDTLFVEEMRVDMTHVVEDSARYQVHEILGRRTACAVKVSYNAKVNSFMAIVPNQI
jgi:hypothetical protein